MSKNVLVIGGTRFFGMLLVEQLVHAGHRVTIATRGQAPDAFADRVERIKVDRRDEAAMTAAFAGVQAYDIVFDQLCYSPLDAAISTKVFKGRVKRYVMSSTIEVYSHLHGQLSRPFLESDVDLSSQAIEMDYPWHAPEVAEQSYAMGKRQAEAFFYQDASLPVTSVRIGHVLAGPADFTGRLADYVTRARKGEPLRYSVSAGKSSFTHPSGISDFLCWAGHNTFLGPINAASEQFSASDLHLRAAALLDRVAHVESVARRVKPSELSPFDYPAPYVMDTDRARSLGYRFNGDPSWLDACIGQHETARGR